MGPESNNAGLLADSISYRSKNLNWIDPEMADIVQ